MDTALQKIKKIHADISELQKQNEQLRNKKDALKTQRDSLELEFKEKSAEYKEAVFKNIAGNLTDVELLAIQENISSSENWLKTVNTKLDAIDSLLKDNSSRGKKLTESLPTARLHLIEAAYNERAKSVTPRERDTIAELWALKSRLPGSNYINMINQLFPHEVPDQVMARWDRFHKKYEKYIDH